jgi:hypothetical protein
VWHMDKEQWDLLWTGEQAIWKTVPHLLAAGHYAHLHSYLSGKRLRRGGCEFVSTGGCEFVSTLIVCASDVVYYCRTYYKAVRWGRRSGGHVLQLTLCA